MQIKWLKNNFARRYTSASDVLESTDYRHCTKLIQKDGFLRKSVTKELPEEIMQASALTEEELRRLDGDSRKHSCCRKTHRIRYLLGSRFDIRSNSHTTRKLRRK